MFSFRGEEDSPTIQSRLSTGTSVDVRPMTAVSGAGYQGIHSKNFGKCAQNKFRELSIMHVKHKFDL